MAELGHAAAHVPHPLHRTSLMTDIFFSSSKLMAESEHSVLQIRHPAHFSASTMLVADSTSISPFEIRLSTKLPNTTSSQTGFGRSRWMPDGKKIAFVGFDDAGLTGVFVQDFVPGQDTTATRRKLAGFDPDYITESFAISPDGTRIAFMGKSFGDAFEIDLSTKMTRLLTGHFHHEGFLRVQYLPNGDFFLIGAPHFTDIRMTSRFWGSPFTESMHFLSMDS
jgi:WD40 repeat protein